MPKVTSFAIHLVLLLIVRASQAQTVTGTIVGIVMDPTNGLVSQARVTIAEENTGRQRTLLTDADGGYVAPFLPVGTYTVTVEQSGFRKASFTGVALRVDEQVRL